MSRNKRPSAADNVYSTVFGQFARNGTNDRKIVIEMMYNRIFSELAANRFKWYGMPDTVDVRYMEMSLLYTALSLFYWDTDYNKFMALRATPQGFPNIMDNPTAFTVVGNNHKFKGKVVNANNAVPIWGNYLRAPDTDIIAIYSHRLAELDYTIEINSLNARRNKVILTSDNTRLSGQNISQQMEEGVNGIQINATGPLADLEFVKALDLGINPDSLEKLSILRARIWNEAVGMLGIDNANQDKKERLVATEVDANNDQTSMMRYVNLNSRRMAADSINKRYGIDAKPVNGRTPLTERVWVEYNTEVDKQAQQAAESLDMGADTE